MLALIEVLGRQGKLPLVAWAVAIIGAITGLAFVAGPGFALPILYVLPVAVASWFAGRSAGSALAFLCSLLWLALDVWNGVGLAEVPYWNAALRLVCLLALAQFLAGLNVALQYARTDYLTGIPNNRAFYDLAQGEMARSRRYGSPFTLVYLDIDDIHAVNQRFGHSVGDALIRSLAVTLRKSLRGSDLVARLGADDFAILLPETGPEAAQGVLRKLETVLAVASQKSQWASSLSIGGVTFLSAPDTVEGALNRAEDQMYAAKKADPKATSVRWHLESVTPKAQDLSA
jgi:diguanylate cyclase (GGDEF)-like protein